MYRGKGAFMGSRGREGESCLETLDLRDAGEGSLLLSTSVSSSVSERAAGLERL